ncbi:DUF5677 domain-containing protein [Methylophilus sp. TWE2]|uniref:DUF5677 domain-containing protein n=1 Tax=Methylophilus sp. TWE2 TaxID=1662285 RepID=UPI000671035B|nr:DUF5677 domain-containing protein [Methylophilus sp. TWE2]AKR42215.1 hypothetical protein ACJ67_01300 [Methylophilus sp. TWE2]
MSNEDMNINARRFFESRCISTEMGLNKFVLEAAEIIELTNNEVNKLVGENIDRLNDETVWSIVHDMYEKCYEFTGGALATFIISHIASAEALCRTAVESAVNLQYVTIGDDIGNVLGYLREYIATERKQNRAWLNSVEKPGNSEHIKKYHRDLITNKDRSLDSYESSLRIAFAISGIDYDEYPGSWPNIFERFSKIGNEIAYRTVYAALCSQAHNDPEDILNNLIARASSNTTSEKAVQIETYAFSLNMVLTSMMFYIEASALYLGKYNIEVAKTFNPLFERASTLTLELQTSSRLTVASLLAE